MSFDKLLSLYLSEGMMIFTALLLVVAIIVFVKSKGRKKPSRELHRGGDLLHSLSGCDFGIKYRIFFQPRAGSSVCLGQSR